MSGAPLTTIEAAGRTARSPRPPWDDAAVAELTWWRVVGGLSYWRCALKMGRTRGAVANAIQRHIHGKRYAGGKKYQRKAVRKHGIWSERSLTEPYAARKLRLQAEKRTTIQLTTTRPNR